MQTLKRFVALNLSLLFLLAGYLQVQAADTANTELQLEITAGSLDVTASSTAAFASTNFSFDGQTSADNDLGTVTVTDTRGTYVGWGVDITGEDWINVSSDVMDYDGDGMTEGRLTLKPGDATLTSVDGQDTTGITLGTNDNFGSSPIINLATASADYGSGEYEISNFKADQFIPGNQEAGTYQMTLTLTAS